MRKFRYCVFINLLGLATLPTLANAAGTYYTGAAYQPAQYRYGQTGTYATSGYGRASNMNNNQMANPNVRYSTVQQTTTQRSGNVVNNTGVRGTQQKTQTKTSSSKNGFFVNGGLSHESASWRFDMNEAKSILHYDDVAWNVLDLNGGYVFDLGKVKMQVDAGFKYGMQWDEATMVDDDISNGGYIYAENTEIKEYGHTVSVGTSKDGNMFGFNLGVGLTDFMRLGNVRMTPSVGYRYFKYKLETKDNRAVSVTTSDVAGGCYDYLGQIVCDPAIVLHNGDGGTSVIVTRDNNGYIPIAPRYQYIEPDGTAYYEQPGVSHSYEVEWSGPYVAMDLDYDINQKNTINGRLELGFPGYTATGDQPYRWDWAHPKSVEDSAGMFSAFHLALAGNWKTAISNTVSLSFGVTYDYYTVSGAKAETFSNQELYNALVNKGDGRTQQETRQMNALYDTYQSCGGWVCSADKEIDSIYKSMGLRIGVDARF